MYKAKSSIFNSHNRERFENLALETYNFQYQQNTIYRAFCNYLAKTPNQVLTLSEIPFLPIEFFKSKDIVSSQKKPELIFTSSGTSGSVTSKHPVIDVALYVNSFTKTFEHFYGSPKEYCILALLPAYLERKGSSLIYMVNTLMELSEHPKNGFFLYDHEKLRTILEELEATNQKTLLIGVSFALLDFVQSHQMNLKNTIVMETGGMKGRKKELIREELHQQLTNGFGVKEIHSEYGMTELLSQAYSLGNGLFKSPPWMKVLPRNTEDPLSTESYGKTSGLNIIDLANQYSCSFIATQDLGRVFEDGSFEVLGRFDHSDVRGCNLMAL